jgi:hypothetical protein
VENEVIRGHVGRMKFKRLFWAPRVKLYSISCAISRIQSLDQKYKEMV